MKIDFKKSADKLVPAVVQDANTNKVLMLGYMNKEAFKKTKKSGKVTFFSRSRQEIWEKGETSGNFLEVKKILLDCDSDTLLIKAIPNGAVCHTGKDTCFKEKNKPDNFLFELEEIIEDRKNNPKKSSYTSRMFTRGVNYIVKKFGEESFELAIEAKDADDKLFKAEAADMLYFFTVMLVERNIKLEEVLEVLRKRRR
ncbi:MAG: bifunctional phosphoribosyl-AMP cyclohydrolase/phosphoribosyl-ATP diphosphatase HisIE [Aridibacter sp.]